MMFGIRAFAQVSFPEIKKKSNVFLPNTLAISHIFSSFYFGNQSIFISPSERDDNLLNWICWFLFVYLFVYSLAVHVRRTFAEFPICFDVRTILFN